MAVNDECNGFHKKKKKNKCHKYVDKRKKMSLRKESV